MIDRRFISTSFVVNGTVDSFPENPTANVQYLVQGASSDELSDYENYIIRYNGTAWEYIPPRSDMLEIINSQTGEILHYDGTNWIVAANTSFITVDDIVDFDYAGSDDDSKINGIVGATFISSKSAGDYIGDIIYASTGKDTRVIAKDASEGYRVAVSSDRKIFTADSSGSFTDSVTANEKDVILLKVTGALYRHDGTKYVPIGSEGVVFVDNVVNLDYRDNSQDALVAVKGTKFISINGAGPYSNYIYYTANGTDSPDTAEIAENSTVTVAVLKDGVIYSHDNDGYWRPYLVPSTGCIIISKADSSMYIKDGMTKKFISVGGSGGSGLKNEAFTLTSSNIDNKSITVVGNIASGSESSVLCFVGGTVHFAGTDFTASGDSISWDGKTLDTVGLKEGDTFVVQYMKA